MVSAKVAGLGFMAVSAAVVIFILSSGVTESGQRVDVVVFEVVYGGSFNVTVTDNGQVKTQSKYGLMRGTLVRVGEEEWVISLSVEKLDAGNGVLQVYFKTVEGEVLASDSTSEPLGVASISLTL